MTERAAGGRSRSRSLQEIESDIARTRGRINRTLDVLGERLKPKNLARQAIEQAIDRTRPLVRKAAETSAMVRAVLPAISSQPARGAATKAKGGSPGGPGKKERRAKKVGAALADAAAAAMIAAVCAPAPEPMKKRVRSTSRMAAPPLDKVQARATTSRRASRSGAGSARRSRSSAKSRRAR
jgi:hypothetical protein